MESSVELRCLTPVDGSVATFDPRTGGEDARIARLADAP
jgi:hypothetical protein